MRRIKILGRSIPVLAIVAIVMVAGMGLAAASYLVHSYTAEVTVKEPLELTEIQPPGTFWDWRHPEEPMIDIDIYAGMDLGAAGYGGKYFIHNLSPQPITVTVTVYESSGQMEWYGLKGCYATTGWSGEDTCNYDNPIVDLKTNSKCWSTGSDDAKHSCTFELGTEDYVYADLTAAGKTTADIQELLAAGDSNCAKFFVDGKLSDGADPKKPLIFVVDVLRGWVTETTD